MKKTHKIFAVTIALVMLMGCITASASDKEVLDNDRFYVEMPEGFEQDNTMTSNYYFTDSDYTEIEFFVEGNLQFPDGIAKTDEDVISRRAQRIIESTRVYVTVDEVSKCTVNGFNAALINGSNDFYESPFRAYVFATVETVYVVYCESFDEADLDKLDDVVETFAINGTYFPGDEPTIEHDFSEAANYYSAYEKYSENYNETTREENIDTGGVFIILFLVFISPVAIVISIVFIVKNHKKKKIIQEYERYVGHISALRDSFNFRQMNPVAMPMYGNPYQQYTAPPQNAYPSPVPFTVPQPQPVNQSVNEPINQPVPTEPQLSQVPTDPQIPQVPEMPQVPEVSEQTYINTENYFE